MVLILDVSSVGVTSRWSETGSIWKIWPNDV